MIFNLNSSWYKSSAVVLLATILGEIVLPTAVHAITSGPTQPEFTSFEPLGTSGMINEFTGGFSYNIPLLEVPGPHGSSYPITLSYHSGATPEEDASWVGFGWTLNAGAINRSVRGFPDDFRGQTVTQFNNTPASETYSVGLYGTIQAASYDLARGDVSVLYNNYTGFSTMRSLEIGDNNFGAIRFDQRNGVNKFSYSINWGNLFSIAASSIVSSKLWSIIEQGFPTSGLKIAAAVNRAVSSTNGIPVSVSLESSISSYLFQSFNSRSRPTSATNMRGMDIVGQFGLTLGIPPGPLLIGAQVGATAMYMQRYPERKLEKNAYGYLYDGESNASDNLTDFSLERDAPWSSRDRYLYPSYQTHDLFMCVAQGMGGGFRLWHDRPGYSQSTEASSNVYKSNVGLEPGTLPDKVSLGAQVTFGAEQIIQGSGISDDHAFRSLRHKSFYDADRNVRARMRFNNDPASSVRYSSSVGAQSPSIEPGMGIGFEAWNFADSHPFYARVNNYSSNLDRVPSSTHITYRINKEMVKGLRERISTHPLLQPMIMIRFLTETNHQYQMGLVRLP